MKRKSLTNKVFLHTFILGAAIYSFCTLTLIFTLYKYFEQQIFTTLKSESALVEDYVLNRQFDKLKNLDTKNRITVIDESGNVFFDNIFEPSTLKNHSDRKDFTLAMQNGSVMISRLSETKAKKYLYYAKKLPDGNVLRLACSQHSVWTLIYGMGWIFAVLFLIAVIVSAVSARIASKRIVEPLNRIDLENPDEKSVYEELKPFIKRIIRENEEKSQREKMRQEFSANVSHELKTPLTSILGFAELLKDGISDEKTVQDFSTTIYDETTRMIKLVSDIIKLSRLDEKSIELEKEEVSLKEVALDALDSLKTVASKKDIKVEITGEDGVIFAVRPVIYEMVYNLIENGIKYNKAGGHVKVNVSTSDDDNDSNICLTVKDNGIGIPKNQINRIFERFYRVDKRRSKKTGGTGLGLSIVKHAAKYHNASVSVDSEEGMGSVFTVTFSA